MTATEWNPLRANMAGLGLVPVATAYVNPDAPEALKESLRRDPQVRLAESWAVPAGSVAIRQLCPGTGQDAEHCTCQHC